MSARPRTEGQGLPTIRRALAANGNPPAEFEVGPDRVVCTIRAHPRSLDQGVGRSNT